MILNLLKENALQLVNTRKVADVRIGLSYTAVQLDDGSAGTAMTFHHDIPQGCLSAETPLKGRPAAELIEKAVSENLIERTLAIAAMNAVTNRHGDTLIPGDALKLLQIGKDDVVGMVGFFGPLVAALKGEVAEMHIFEKSKKKAENLHPEKDIPKILPGCTAVVITSTSLINRTFEGVMECTGNCRKIAMIGATTPLVREVFAEYGISLLSGLVIREPDEVLRVISESGGMRSFSRFTDKVNLICRD